MANYDEEKYLSVQEVAELYNVKPSWLYDQISEGNIPAYKLPGRRGMHMLRSDVEAFMKPKRVNPPKSETA